MISHDSRTRSFRQIYFNHMVHHVAQLGVYHRLNNLPVPALYGPSAHCCKSSQCYAEDQGWMSDAEPHSPTHPTSSYRSLGASASANR